jgi:hypothetical protein
MSKTNRLIKFDMDSEMVIRLVKQRLAELGVRIVRSFDFQSACASYPDLLCPHHGDAHCDCQLVVLLAYGEGATPASLIVHSYRGQTEIDLVDTPKNRPDKELVKNIRLAFEAGIEPSFT